MPLGTSMTSLNALVEAAKIVETERDQRVSQALKDIGLFHSSVEEEDSLRRRPGGAGTREIHNKLEKNRRAHMKECFEKLKTHIPNLESKKASNLGILIGASSYIQKLKEQDRQFEKELETLASNKLKLQERMHALSSDIKKELLQQQLFAQVQKEKRTSLSYGDAKVSEQSNIKIEPVSQEEEDNRDHDTSNTSDYDAQSSCIAK